MALNVKPIIKSKHCPVLDATLLRGIRYAR